MKKKKEVAQQVNNHVIINAPILSSFEKRMSRVNKSQIGGIKERGSKYWVPNTSTTVWKDYTGEHAEKQRLATQVPSESAQKWLIPSICVEVKKSLKPFQAP